jgi:predicted dinucleotide-binding enzyme
MRLAGRIEVKSATRPLVIGPDFAKEAARSGEVVIVTIPEGRVPDLPGDLFGIAEDVVVVDTGNYYPRERDGRINEIEAGLRESRWVEGQMEARDQDINNNLCRTSYEKRPSGQCSKSHRSAGCRG